MAIKTVGIVVNRTRREPLEFALKVTEWLTQRGVEVRIDQEAATSLQRMDLACDEETLARTDLIITLGGDGTILTASHVAARHNIPILGVHMERFGFIAESHPDDLMSHLDSILTGDYKVEERMMVHGEVVRGGDTVYRADGLNDIVINKGATARMLHLETGVGGEPVGAYPADGVIVATPTGSTAYSLSAGGPLVEPTVQALLLVPICAHTLAARPFIIPATETVTIDIQADGGEVLFIADSYRVFPLHTGDRVNVRRADCSAHIVRLNGAGFYRKVHQRLLWGERLNA